MTEKTYNVLFLCTGNSARSIMAEAMISTLGKGKFKGYSAGSQPGGAVNPFAMEKVEKTGYPLENLRSKSWDEFAGPNAPAMDFIITVCDNAAGEVCPIWPGHPASAHWSFSDPAAVQGTDDEKRAAFDKVFRQLATRIHAFISLPLPMLDKAAIQQAVRNIGDPAVIANE